MNEENKDLKSSGFCGLNEDLKFTDPPREPPKTRPDPRMQRRIEEQLHLLERHHVAPSYRHGEAFMMMHYACRAGCCHEWIWNSRDGVTPFIEISKRGHEMEHINWRSDICAVNHKPCKGDRIFVDATPELVRPSVLQYVDKYWEPGENHPGMKTHWSTKEEATEFFVKDWCKEHSPFLLTVEEDWPAGSDTPVIVHNTGRTA